MNDECIPFKTLLKILWLYKTKNSFTIKTKICTLRLSLILLSIKRIEYDINIIII